MLKGKLYLNNQECEGNYDFINVAGTYMTQGFAEKFGDEAKEIVSKALWMILDEYKTGIHIVTALLPEEY